MLSACPEPFAPFFGEVGDLLDLHYSELALHQRSVPLSPQHHVYAERDARGEILYVALRDAGKLIGYFIGFVNPGLHYSTCLTLLLDVFFIHPDHRKGSGGMRLFRTVEAEARRRGVQRIFVGSKLHKDASRLFEALDYEPVEVHFSKWIGDEPVPAVEAH